jgi:hypothetical protein
VPKRQQQQQQAATNAMNEHSDEWAAAVKAKTLF